MNVISRFEESEINQRKLWECDFGYADVAFKSNVDHQKQGRSISKDCHGETFWVARQTIRRITPCKVCSRSSDGSCAANSFPSDWSVSGICHTAIHFAMTCENTGIWWWKYQCFSPETVFRPSANACARWDGACVWRPSRRCHICTVVDLQWHTRV